MIRRALQAAWNLCVVALVCWALFCAAIVALYFLLAFGFVLAIWSLARA